MEPMLMSVGDACLALGLGRTTVYRLINSETLDTVIIGKRRMVRAESVRRMAGEKSNG